MFDEKKNTLVALACIFLMGGLGVAGHLWRAPQLNLPHHQTMETIVRDYDTVDEILPLSELFNVNRLPELPPPARIVAPPPDPFAQIKRYRLQGVIEGDGKSIVILSNKRGTAKLFAGDVFYSAKIINVGPDSVTFSIHEDTYTLTIK